MKPRLAGSLPPYLCTVKSMLGGKWVQDMGYIEKSVYGGQREKDTYPAKLVDVQSPFGTITELAPAVQFEHSPLVDILPVRPFGADKPVFWR